MRYGSTGRDRILRQSDENVSIYSFCDRKICFWRIVVVRIVSSYRVLGLACATIGRWIVVEGVLKSVVNITCLRYTPELTMINLSKTRKDFANEVWVRERMFGRIEEG